MTIRTLKTNRLRSLLTAATTFPPIQRFLLSATDQVLCFANDEEVEHA